MKPMRRFFIVLILFVLSLVQIVAQEGVQKTKSADDKIYEEVDSAAVYPGGISKMHEFIAQNLKYPVASQKKGEQGRVIIRVTVSKDGVVSNHKIEKSRYALLGEEALRLAKRMPKKGWTPAMVDGAAVNSYFLFPLRFRLK